MNIHLNISPKILIRLTKAIEKLAHDYAIVHAVPLERMQHLDKKAGRTYYQSDAEVYKEEQKQKLKDAIEYGDAS